MVPPVSDWILSFEGGVPVKRRQMILLAGGQSDEHEVSLQSARAVVEATAGGSIDVQVQVIGRDGTWLDPEASRQTLAGSALSLAGRPLAEGIRVLDECDVVFPLVHGPRGEDGTLQGVLELLNVPYVGSGVLASALCMDKPMSKDALAAASIPQVAYRLVTAHQWHQNRDQVLAVATELPPPWFVKPANLGSSVGIQRATHAKALSRAIEAALGYDRRVIVEEGLSKPQELEVAVLGNDEPQISPVGEITFGTDFYDYDTKYTDGRAQLHIPSSVDADVARRAQHWANQAFLALDCAGLARVDFLYDAGRDRLVLNEVNTLPGFTPFSMYPKLWEHVGLTYDQLIDRLVDLALDRHGRTP